MRRIFKYFVGKHGRTVAEYTQAMHDPWLRQCINYLFLPEVPVWFLYMLLALLADRQVGLLEGGCLEFVRPLERRFRDLGGQITYGATVEEIQVQDGKAVGVRLADPAGTPGSGQEHRADAVISAADGYSTIFQMLGGRYVDDKIRHRYQSWKLCRPFLLVSFGVARQLPDEPAFTTLLLEHPLTVGSQTVEGLFVRILNYGPRFAPPGKTIVQAEFEAEWDHWNDLQREDRARYDAEKERVAAEILERLEVHYPGLASQAEVVDVATPYTTWRYTLNQKGAWGGWLLTPGMITARVERTLPGLKGFVMAGQWVMPGGGVPSCLYSGRHAVQILCREHGKPFTAGVL
jgi:phytoene dehydrogenase-like protein